MWGRRVSDSWGSYKERRDLALDPKEEIKENCIPFEQAWKEASPLPPGMEGSRQHPGATEETPPDMKGHVRVKAA